MPKLICISGMGKGEEFILKGGDNKIGRSETNDICVIDKKSSRNHCKVVLEDNQLVLVDLNSTNGVRVNNVFIKAPAPVMTGDEIRIGQTVYLVANTEKELLQSNDLMTETEKVIKQKKYINLLQKTAFQSTPTVNFRRVEPEEINRGSGFLAYFKEKEASKDEDANNDKEN